MAKRRVELAYETRSSRGAYQKWATITGDSSYEFDRFNPFFKKSAQYHPPIQHSRLQNSTAFYDAGSWSPEGGPLQVGYPAWINPISSWIAKGLASMGFKELRGMTNGDIFGYTYVAFSQDPRSQTRSSSESSYLRQSLRKSSNLLIYKNTMGKRVLFNDKKRAIGVIVASGGISFQLNATKEVILCAGVFRSPQMLMVSGVGSSDVLSKLNIKVVADLPGVGQNMWVRLV
jgi:choline dehydrogenase-like flavoprotein